MCLTLATAIDLRRSPIVPTDARDGRDEPPCDRRSARIRRVVSTIVDRARLPLLVGLLGALLGGCGFDTGGVASGGASVGTLGGPTTGTGTDDAAKEEEAEDDAPEGGAGVDDGGDAPVTDAATSDPGDGDATADPTGDPTTRTTTAEEGSSGGSDPTTGGSDPTTGGSDPTTSGDDGPTVPPYPNCSAPDTCEDAMQECYEYFNWGTLIANICMPPCVVPADCPPAREGTAMAVCWEDGFCRLDCTGGLMCPAEMDCILIDGGLSRCAYPT
jgi:hypothetical protein